MHRSIDPVEVPGCCLNRPGNYHKGLYWVCCVCCLGHMVPGTSPREALDMFSRFIAGESLTARSSSNLQQQGQAAGAAAAAKGVAVA
jgi:hypothetical protein